MPCPQPGEGQDEAGGRGKRGLFLNITVSPGTEVYRLLTGAAGFLVPTCSLNADLCGFSWLLIVPPGRRYTSGMSRREDSSSGGGIQLARKNQILIFPDVLT